MIQERSKCLKINFLKQYDVHGRLVLKLICNGRKSSVFPAAVAVAMAR